MSNEMLRWAFPTLFILGVLITVLNTKLSSRMVIVLLGFVGAFGAAVGPPVLQWHLTRSPGALHPQQVINSLQLLNLLGVFSLALLVFGLGLVFADLGRQLDNKASRDAATAEAL